MFWQASHELLVFWKVALDRGWLLPPSPGSSG